MESQIKSLDKYRPTFSTNYLLYVVLGIRSFYLGLSRKVPKVTEHVRTYLLLNYYTYTELTDWVFIQLILRFDRKMCWANSKY